MTKGISDGQLFEISQLVARHFGLHFAAPRWPDLERGVCAAAREWGCRDQPGSYIQQLLSTAVTKNHLEVLAGHLTVGETYFFREKRSLEVFEIDIVPELMRTRPDKLIRIWSAGCASGEEPYSIAIMLSRLTASLREWNVEILATDLNTRSLEKASAGIYGEWSFRGVSPRIRSAYFEAAGKDRWAVSSAVKKMVSFAQLNLMDDFLPPFLGSSTFDVIFCRNVLMYFTPEGMRKVVQQLHRCLASDGWLIVSSTEMSRQLFSGFTTIVFGDLALYRKSATQAQQSPVLPSVLRDGEWFSTQPAERRLENPGPAAAPPDSTRHQGQDLLIQAENMESRALIDKPETEGAVAPGDPADAQAMLLRARTHADRGELVLALTWCDKAIAADKMAARSYYLRAIILQEQGLLPDALVAFQQTVYAEPRFVLGHFSLGNLALAHGRLRESQKHFENVLLSLASYKPEDIVPESEGLSAARLREMVVSPRSLAPIVRGAAQARIR